MSLNSSFEMQGMPMGGYGGLGAGGLGGLGLFGLIGLNGLGGGNGLFGGNNNPNNIVSDKNISDIREEVMGVQASLTQTLMGLEANLQGKIADSDKQAMASMYEAKLASVQSTNEITNKIGNETQVLAAQVGVLQNNMNQMFAHTNERIGASTQTILNQLTADKLDEKNDIIEQLRSERIQLQNINMFGQQFSAINSAIADLSQTQKLTNQVVQFGAGNFATPVATNNQVR